MIFIVLVLLINIIVLKLQRAIWRFSFNPFSHYVPTWSFCWLT